jgi:3-oxoacyl-[acyl-carrier protein] reductase
VNVTNTPLRRIEDAEEMANTVSFLVSDVFSFITGEISNVSGGWYMRG